MKFQKNKYVTMFIMVSETTFCLGYIQRVVYQIIKIIIPNLYLCKIFTVAETSLKFKNAKYLIFTHLCDNQGHQVAQIKMKQSFISTAELKRAYQNKRTNIRRFYNCLSIKRCFLNKSYITCGVVFTSVWGGKISTYRVITRFVENAACLYSPRKLIKNSVIVLECVKILTFFLSCLQFFINIQIYLQNVCGMSIAFVSNKINICKIFILFYLCFFLNTI